VAPYDAELSADKLRLFETAKKRQKLNQILTEAKHTNFFNLMYTKDCQEGQFF
jgi:hypothetical protein